MYRAIRLFKTVIGWNDDCVRTDRRVSTDCEVSMSVKNTVGADVSGRADFNAAAIWRDDDAVRNNDSL